MEMNSKVTRSMETAVRLGNKDFPPEVLLGYAPCDKCGSRDNLAVYSAHAHCFGTGCGFHEVFESEDRLVSFKESIVEPAKGGGVRPTTPFTGRAPKASYRGISPRTMEVYGVTVMPDAEGNPVKVYYPYFKNGLLVASMTRFTDPKGFSWAGTEDGIKSCELFGQHVVPAGGKFLVIVEGQNDAMSVYEMTGYGGVSVRSATSAVEDCKKQYEYINSFESIVLALDNDEAGAEAANKVARLFKPGKVRIMKLGKHKDANDFLKAGEKTLWDKCFWRAETFSVNGILAGSSLWDAVAEDLTYDSIEYPFNGLNRKLYGLRTHELVTFTAGTGMGKTTLLKFIAVHLSKLIPKGSNIGMIMLEESTRETTLGLMSVTAKIPFHLPDAKYDIEVKRKAWEETFGKDKFFLHENEHFDSSTISGILNQIRTFVKAYDCKYIILDHISIVVSDQENGDERRALDELMTKLKRLTMELGICIIVVSHLRRVSGTSAEEGGQVTLQDLRGTNAIAQLSNIVVALERNSQAEDQSEANRTRLRVLKNRFCGRLGVACELEFDDAKYEFKEIEYKGEIPDEPKVPSRFSEPFNKG
jgi:twinkle protein